jgi:hypothetical protein
MNQAEALAARVAAEFRRRVLGEYVPRIRACVRQLTEEQCWRKPSPHGNSIANLLLHMDGNLRQWLLAGLGGDRDERVRAAEFAARPAEVAASAAELVNRLEASAQRAAALVEALPVAAWLQRKTFQSGPRARFDDDGVGAVLHVLEHLSGHAGQIYQWTKQMLGTDLRFYDL